MIKNIIISALFISTSVSLCLLASDVTEQGPVKTKKTKAPWEAMFSPVSCDTGKMEAKAYQQWLNYNPNEPAAIRIDTAHLRSIISSSKKPYIVGVFGRYSEVQAATGAIIQKNTIILFPVKANDRREEISSSIYTGGKVDQKYPTHKNPAQTELSLGNVNYDSLFYCY